MPQNNSTSQQNLMISIMSFIFADYCSATNDYVLLQRNGSWPRYKYGNLTLIKFAKAFIGITKTGDRTFSSGPLLLKHQQESVVHCALLIPDACIGSRVSVMNETSFHLPAIFSRLNFPTPRWSSFVIFSI